MRGRRLTFVQRYLAASTAGVRAAACALSVESPSVASSITDRASDHRLRWPWHGLMRWLCVAATRSAA